jgi:nucleoside-diphosphate-sugar epimerase
VEAPDRSLQLDLADAGSVDRLRTDLPRVPFDAVLHLAARTPRVGSGGVGAFAATNILGTEHLLAGLPAAPRRFAYFSTVDVYQHPSGTATLTEDSPVEPESAYAISKYAGERVVWLWGKNHGVPATIVRLAQVYGPGDPTAKAIPTFAAAVAAGRAPIVHGSGEETRQPIYIQDVVGAVQTWLCKAADDAHGTLLLSGRELITIYQLACLVMTVAGVSGSPQRVPLAQGKIPRQERFDATRTEQQLGWRASTSLKEGIRSVLDAIASGGRVKVVGSVRW